MRFLTSKLAPACAVLALTIILNPVIQAATTPVVKRVAIETKDLQEDFPALCLDRSGTPCLAYVAFDGQSDRLKIARMTKSGLAEIGTVAGPGVIHQPSLACDGRGTLWVVWSELDDLRAWKLKARAIVNNVVQPETVILEKRSGSAIFSHAGADAKGRVWVAWQSFRSAAGDIFAKYFDPSSAGWSKEIHVTTDAAGDWEPRLAFANDDAAWITFDSSRDGVFNVLLARVSPDGQVKTVPLSDSPRYEARPSIAATKDGDGFWLAWESGKEGWGLNTRGVAGTIGLNADRRIVVARFDIATQTVSTATDVTPVLKSVPLDQPTGRVLKKQGAKKRSAKKQPATPPGVETLNLPTIFVDASGHVWVACRYFRATHWRIALTRYDTTKKQWSKATSLEASSFGQDRRCHWAGGGGRQLWLTWPSDLRTTKTALTSGVYLAQINAAHEFTPHTTRTSKPKAAQQEVVVRWGDDTPERSREDRHRFTADGDTYGLYWGDFHRHTDVSNCRTPHDGCIVEQFRYALDVGRLDMLGTSDHTDIGKPYDPYEWWCNQKLADVFHVPGYFSTFYVYEREQRWPWGHRNVIFTERDAPIIYIKRSLYRAMPWNQSLPVSDGPAEIAPTELWKMLRDAGKPVTIISHTGATNMGTNWDGYKEIDAAVENLVEIYQGARVSYEGTDTPQPQVGYPRGMSSVGDAHGSVKTGRDFAPHNKGVYQNALQNGLRLGVFANSDHISTHTSFGGVYAKSFTREGLLEGLNARRTIAATDKIFMEFTCNDHLLGEEFTTSERPKLRIAVHGTFRLSVITIVRNETDYRQFRPQNSRDFETTFVDEQPVAGENRYYLRVQQFDGNMGWTSPIWVTYQQ